MKARPEALYVLIAAALSVPTAAAGEPDETVRTVKHVLGSTTKLEQLIGDYDKHLQKRTHNQTWSRYRIRGTDLGESFEHGGELVFLFGDTIGPGGGDCIASSTTTDPEGGLKLDFYRGADSNYLKIRPPGVRMGGFEVPTGGISVQGRAYLFCTTDHSQQHVMGRSVLVRFEPENKSFETLRNISTRPGNFINIAARLAPPGTGNLPGKANSQRVLLWGSGEYRRSNAYLACVEAEQWEQGDATYYFAGLDDQEQPRWVRDESAATPVVEHPVIGELSTTWCERLKIWLMTYNSGRPRGILLRWSRTPWGPWSDAIPIFVPWRDGGYGKFMRVASAGDKGGPWGPVIGSAGDPRRIWGGEYGPYMIERFTQVNNSQLTIYYVMSTWNPYTVVLMKSQMAVEFQPEPPRQ